MSSKLRQFALQKAPSRNQKYNLQTENIFSNHHILLVLPFLLLEYSLSPYWQKWSEVKWNHPVVSDSVTLWTVARSGSSVHRTLQARILEWVAISFSRGSSQPRDRTWVSCIAGRCFILWITGEAPWKYEFKAKRNGYFPSGSAANSLCSQIRGHRFDPWSGN